MARIDLVELRDSIRGTGFLTVSEGRALNFWGEAHLLELVETLGAIVEAENELYDEEFADEAQSERERLDRETEPRGQEDYVGYDDTLDVFDDWDIEITCEYDEQ